MAPAGTEDRTLVSCASSTASSVTSTPPAPLDSTRPHCPHPPIYQLRTEDEFGIKRNAQTVKPQAFRPEEGWLA